MQWPGPSLRLKWTGSVERDGREERNERNERNRRDEWEEWMTLHEHGPAKRLTPGLLALVPLAGARDRVFKHRHPPTHISAALGLFPLRSATEREERGERAIRAIHVRSFGRSLRFRAILRISLDGGLLNSCGSQRNLALRCNN